MTRTKLRSVDIQYFLDVKKAFVNYKHKTFKYYFFGAFAKLQKATISFVMSVCLSGPLGSTRLPLDGFS